MRVHDGRVARETSRRDPDDVPTHESCGRCRDRARRLGLNIGIVAARIQLSRVFAHSASKVAVVDPTQNVARGFAVQSARVNALCPGVLSS